MLLEVKWFDDRMREEDRLRAGWERGDMEWPLVVLQVGGSSFVQWEGRKMGRVGGKKSV